MKGYDSAGVPVFQATQYISSPYRNVNNSDLLSLSDKLKKIGARKIMLMLPDGLKPRVFDIVSFLSRQFSILVSSDPFYGACDIGNPALYSGVDAIVQFGHSPIPNINYPIPVIFQEYRLTEFPEIQESALAVIRNAGYSKVGLLASIQYLDMLPVIKKKLEGMGLSAVIGKQDGRMAYPGQVLGCNFSAAHSVASEVDCYLVVSTGKFHAIGAQLSGEREAFLLDVSLGTVTSMKAETDLFLRRRYARISSALNSRKFAVVVDTKIGQYRIRLADLIASQLQSLGKEYVILHTDQFNASDIMNCMADAVIFTGCPRVSIDDYDRFPFPILTPNEFQSLFGFKKSSRYVLDEIVSVDMI
ncbi:MAG: diphthamide biosynthesis enzyme Dph2 [Candidatus Thermoplasmatota archaeon]|nr:diphthamide biosynthesis enzyme Dph2 [Candidatus Thermoplasmatota archaeon]